ncbi:unnamed protein product [Danaus chrysippus]|uniref:(African queen) hypothetical protein n=1 Tax=Danaus chrysippus TaxID=151541 RepID=A0A8J2QM24_9NEOP|nr:unnamed protein product [Danaus chrysippus]
MSSVISSNISDILANQLSDINTELGGLREAMNFFSDQYDNFKKCLETSAATIQKLQTKNDQLTLEVKDLTMRLNLTEQYMRESNLEINGIPEHKTENLVNVIGQLAKTVNVNLLDDDIIQVTRVAKLRNNSNRPRTVIARLRTPRQRDILLAAVQTFNKKIKKRN